MITVYKLTDKNHQTFGGTQWGENVTHKATGRGGLCSPGVIHSYRSALLAVLMNPIHGNFNPAVLWEAECSTILHDDGTKLGSKCLTTRRIIPLPKISERQRVIFGILCAEEALNLVKISGSVERHLYLWRDWAKTYKQGVCVSAADAAYAAANSAAYAVYADSDAASRAAGAADDAAYAAASSAAYAAYAAADAAFAAYVDADAAAGAADDASLAASLAAGKIIDFTELAKQCVETATSRTEESSDGTAL